MPQLLDLADELLLEIVAFVRYDPEQGSHRNLCLTNRRLNSIMHDQKLPIKIAERQLAVEHSLQRNQWEEGGELFMTGFDSYPKTLWYKTQQIREWKLLLNPSYQDNDIVDVAISLTASMYRAGEKLALQRSRFSDGYRSRYNTYAMQIFQVRSLRRLPIEALMLLRYSTISGIAKLAQKQQFDLPSSTSYLALGRRKDRHNLFLTSHLDWKGVIGELPKLGYEQATTFTDLKEANDTADMLAWSVIRSDQSEDSYRHILLFFTMHRQLSTSILFDENTIQPVVPEEDWSTTVPPVAGFVLREGEKTIAVNKYLEELFKDKDRSEKLLQKLDLEAVGESIYTTYREVSFMENEALEKEIDKELAQLDIRRWIREG